MPVLDSNKLREAVSLARSMFADEQTPPEKPVTAPAATQVLPTPDLAEVKERRAIYEKRRTDLIKHGGEKLEKILTRKEYAQIRNDFELGEPADYKREITALDPASRKELAHKTLRDVVALTTNVHDEREFNLQEKSLSRLLTPAANVDRQINDATGAVAKRYDSAIMGEDELKLNRAFRQELAAEDIQNGPALYIRYGGLPENDKQAVKQTLLKDGTSVMVVSLEEWLKKPKEVMDTITSELKEGHFAEREKIDAYYAHFKNTPLRDILTKPELEKMRNDLEIPDFSGKGDLTPRDLDALDQKSRKEIEKMTLSDIVSNNTSIDENGIPKAQFPAVTKDYFIFLIPPADHMRQLAYLESIGDFTKSPASEEDKKKTMTLVDPSTLTGDEKIFYDHYQDMASKMGLSKPPELYYRNYDTGSEGKAVLLKDGTNAVILDKSVAEMSPDQRILTIAHEDGHLNILRKQKIFDLMDMYAAATQQGAKLDNVGVELQADRLGAGPEGVCNSEASVKDLERMFSFGDPKKYSESVDRHLEWLAMGTLTHPLPDTRLEVMRNYDPHGCTPYYPTPLPAKSPVSPER